MCEPFDYPTPESLFFPSKWHLAEADPGEGPRRPCFYTKLMPGGPKKIFF